VERALLLRGKLMTTGLQHQETAGDTWGQKNWGVECALILRPWPPTTRPNRLDHGPWTGWLLRHTSSEPGARRKCCMNHLSQLAFCTILIDCNFVTYASMGLGVVHMPRPTQCSKSRTIVPSESNQERRSAPTTQKLFKAARIACLAHELSLCKQPVSSAVLHLHCLLI